MQRQEFIRQIKVNNRQYDIADISLLQEKGIADINNLPFSIRILVENLLRKLDGRIVNGQGADTDIVIASAKAYVNAVNKIIQPQARAHPQLGDV